MVVGRLRERNRILYSLVFSPPSLPIPQRPAPRSGHGYLCREPSSRATEARFLDGAVPERREAWYSLQAFPTPAEDQKEQSSLGPGRRLARFGCSERLMLAPALEAVLGAFANRIVPGEGLAIPGAGSRSLLAVQRILMGQSPSVLRRIKLLLRALEWGALPRYGHPFSRLRPEQQDRYLRAWERSSIPLWRFGFAAMRNLVLVAYYSQPENWPGIGYPGPTLESGADSIGAGVKR